MEHRQYISDALAGSILRDRASAFREIMDHPDVDYLKEGVRHALIDTMSGKGILELAKFHSEDSLFGAREVLIVDRDVFIQEIGLGEKELEHMSSMLRKTCEKVLSHTS